MYRYRDVHHTKIQREPGMLEVDWRGTITSRMNEGPKGQPWRRFSFDTSLAGSYTLPARPARPVHQAYLGRYSRARARFRHRDAPMSALRGSSCWPKGEGRQGRQLATLNHLPLFKLNRSSKMGALSCRELMVPMTHDYYSGVLSHYRPLDATRPIVPCILISGQANESGAVPELVRPRAKVKWILRGTRAYKHAVKYHSHRLQTAIVAILAGQQQDTCRDKQHCISSLCLRLITVRAPTYLPTYHVRTRETDRCHPYPHDQGRHLSESRDQHLSREPGDGTGTVALVGPANFGRD